jgi:hypothetical protein
MDHDAIAFGDEFVDLLVVIRKGGPCSLDHGADAVVSLAKGVRAIVPYEVRSIELRNPLEAAAVPDRLGDFANQPLVLLAHIPAFISAIERRYQPRPKAVGCMPKLSRSPASSARSLSRLSRTLCGDLL